MNMLNFNEEDIKKFRNSSPRSASSLFGGIDSSLAGFALYLLHPSRKLEDIDDEHNNQSSTAAAATSPKSNGPLPAGMGISRRASSSWWNPFDSIRYLTSDPFFSIIGRVTFLCYTALHASMSTLVLYGARQFHLGPHRL
eukprot:CCRYP_016429-RA/>CCRYP_016429-RA protein AED:0.48 eAED:0.46 QI:0/0/0/1/0/0/2/0/139